MGPNQLGRRTACRWVCEECEYYGDDYWEWRDHLRDYHGEGL